MALLRMGQSNTCRHCTLDYNCVPMAGRKTLLAYAHSGTLYDCCGDNLYPNSTNRIWIIPYAVVHHWHRYNGHIWYLFCRIYNQKPWTLALTRGIVIGLKGSFVRETIVNIVANNDMIKQM